MVRTAGPAGSDESRQDVPHHSWFTAGANEFQHLQLSLKIINFIKSVQFFRLSAFKVFVKYFVRVCQLCMISCCGDTKVLCFGFSLPAVKLWMHAAGVSFLLHTVHPVMIRFCFKNRILQFRSIFQASKRNTLTKFWQNETLNNCNN